MEPVLRRKGGVPLRRVRLRQPARPAPGSSPQPDLPLLHPCAASLGTDPARRPAARRHRHGGERVGGLLLDVHGLLRPLHGRGSRRGRAARRLDLPDGEGRISRETSTPRELLRGLPHLLDVERHLEQPNLLVVDAPVDLLLDVLFENVNDGEPQLDSCQWTHVGRISNRDRLGRDLERLQVGGAEDDHEVVRTVRVDQALDPVLVLRVHCPGRRSDEALRLDEDDFGSRRLDTLGDRGPRHSVTLTERDHLLPVQLHAASPPLAASVANARSMSVFETSPDSRSSSWPSRMSTYVGRPKTLSSLQMSRFSAELTLTTRTAPAASSSSLAMVGIMARHGWHRGPQKSTRTLPSPVRPA